MKKTIFYILFVYFFVYVYANIDNTVYANTQRFNTEEFKSIIREISASNNNVLKVGFDIDETILYDDHIREYLPEYCGDLDFLQCVEQKDLWLYLNTEGLKNVFVKENMKSLLLLHESLGDELYFITARQETENTMKDFLVKNFNIDINDSNIFFVGGSDKSDLIRRLNIGIYYGDSDSDIISANRAGAKSVRILRTDECFYHDSGYTIDKNYEDYLITDSKY